MKLIECTQGEPDWYAARRGKFTASEFDKLITPGGKASTQADGYVDRILAELVMDAPVVGFESPWMVRGKETEAEARDALAFHLDVEPQTVGFYATDDDIAGCSPDAIYNGGGCELKCPSPHVHVRYLIDQRMPSEYVPQVMGSMYVTGAQWWDFASYCPGMPIFHIRVERNNDYIGKLDHYIQKAHQRLQQERGRLIELGYLK